MTSFRKRSVAAALVIGCTVLASNLSTPAFAAGQPLACMEPKILDADPKASFDKLPKVYAEPTAGSPVVATTSAVVYTMSPAQQSGGFTKVVRLNGKPGWVSSEELIAWHNVNAPSTTCSGELRPNGTPHAIYSR